MAFEAPEQHPPKTAADPYPPGGDIAKFAFATALAKASGDVLNLSELQVAYRGTRPAPRISVTGAAFDAAPYPRVTLDDCPTAPAGWKVVATSGPPPIYSFDDKGAVAVQDHLGGDLLQEALGRPQAALGDVRNRAVAEDVAQEAGLGLLRGIDRFEGRSSLKTWLFRIAVNRAITTGVRERTYLPVDDSELEADNGRFGRDGWWVTAPTHWADEAIDRLMAPELAARARTANEQSPMGQRRVVTLRDIEGLSSVQVCAVLDITEANQRVLLHRGRSRVRAELEREMLS